MMMILLFYPRNLPFKFSPNRLNVSFVVVVIVVVVVVVVVVHVVAVDLLSGLGSMQ